MADTTSPPPKLRRPAVDIKRLENGTLIMRSPYELPEPPSANVGAWLRRWAAEDPERLFISKYAGDGQWFSLSYGDAYKHLQPIAQNLLKRKLSAERPLMILSKNGIENALLQLAAMDVGIPAIHLSPSMSLDPARKDDLARVLGQTSPGLVFAADGEPFADALGMAHAAGAEIVVDAEPPSNVPATPFHKLIKSWRTGAAKKAYDKLTPETIAKISYMGDGAALIGVVASQQTLCANQDALAALIPFLTQRPPIVVDDAPWYLSGTGGLVFFMVLRNGGTLYIDRFGEENRVEDFTSPSPTVHVTDLPALSSLIPRLEEDKLLRSGFFRQVELIWVVGATPDANLRARLRRMTQMEKRAEIPVITSFSSGKTMTVNSLMYFDTEADENIGLPLPGSYLKMAARGDLFELRVKTHGPGPRQWQKYQAQPLTTDDEGYFTTGDIVTLVDEMLPFKGVVRVGRFDS